MLAEISGDKWADHVDFPVVLSRPVERCLREFPGDAASTQRRWDFGFEEGQDVACESVFEGSNVSILLKFEASGMDDAWRARFFAASAMVRAAFRSISS